MYNNYIIYLVPPFCAPVCGLFLLMSTGACVQTYMSYKIPPPQKKKKKKNAKQKQKQINKQTNKTAKNKNKKKTKKKTKKTKRKKNRTKEKTYLTIPLCAGILDEYFLIN